MVVTCSDVSPLSKRGRHVGKPHGDITIITPSRADYIKGTMTSGLFSIWEVTSYLEDSCARLGKGANLTERAGSVRSLHYFHIDFPEVTRQSYYLCTYSTKKTRTSFYSRNGL